MKNIKIYLITILLINGFTVFSYGSVKDFINTAYEKRDEIKIAEEQIALSKWRFINAVRGLGPAVMLEYRKSEGETMTTDPYNSENYGLKIEQAIFQGGKKVYSYKREKIALKVAEWAHKRAFYDVRYEVADAYYKVLMNKSMIEGYSDLLEKFEEDYNIARQQFEKEIMTDINYEEIVNIVKSAEIRKKMFEDELAVAKMELQIACGIEKDPVISATKFSSIFSPAVITRSLEECIEIALENRPQMKMAQLIVKQSEYDKKAAAASESPMLVLDGYAGKSGEAFVSDELILAEQWSLHLNLRWLFWGNTFNYRYGQNRVQESTILDYAARTKSDEQLVQFSLLDGLDQLYFKKEQEIVKLQATKDFKKSRLEVTKEVKQVYNQLLRTIELVKVSQDRLEVSRKTVEILNKRRLLGQASLKELMDARNNTAQLETSLYESLYKFYVSVAGLNRSCGKTIIPLDILR